MEACNYVHSTNHLPYSKIEYWVSNKLSNPTSKEKISYIMGDMRNQNDVALKFLIPFYSFFQLNSTKSHSPCWWFSHMSSPSPNFDSTRLNFASALCRHLLLRGKHWAVPFMECHLQSLYQMNVTISPIPCLLWIVWWDLIYVWLGFQNYILYCPSWWGLFDFLTDFWG